MNNGTPSNKSPLWTARQKLGTKRAAHTRKVEKLRVLENEIRVLEATVRSLEEQQREVNTPK